jgi:hypothetical protein
VAANGNNECLLRVVKSLSVPWSDPSSAPSADIYFAKHSLASALFPDVQSLQLTCSSLAFGDLPNEVGYREDRHGASAAGDHF